MTLGLKRRFVVHIVPLVLLVSVAYLAFYVHRTKRMLQTELNRKGLLLSRDLAHASEMGLLTRDEVLFQSLLRRVVEGEDVKYAIVYDAHGEPFASQVDAQADAPVDASARRSTEEQRVPFCTEGRSANGHLVYDFYHPIFAISVGESDEWVGFTRVGVSPDRVSQEGAAALAGGIIMSISLVVCGSAIAIVLARSITKPVGELVRGVEAISTGDLGHQIPLQANDELGKLGATFNKMSKSLKEKTRELEEKQKALITLARAAGMAEVATDILHNVGNVLNSVNVSAHLLAEQLLQSKVSGLKKAADLVAEHADDLPRFVAEHPQGIRLAEYLIRVSQHLTDEHEDALKTVNRLQKNIDHIKEIVSRQQAYATVSGVVEAVSPIELVEDAVEMASASPHWGNIDIVREYDDIASVNVDKHKLMQILVNLVGNAADAMSSQDGSGGVLTLKIKVTGDDHLRIEVIDNGVGIPPDGLTRIFGYGFSTKMDGRGFGLHSAANSATELGGCLSAHSDGPGKGAKFTLDLPLQPDGVEQPHYEPGARCRMVPAHPAKGS